jgi:hypothetical protein
VGQALVGTAVGAELGIGEAFASGIQAGNRELVGTALGELGSIWRSRETTYLMTLTRTSTLPTRHWLNSLLKCRMPFVGTWPRFKGTLRVAPSIQGC